MRRWAGWEWLTERDRGGSDKGRSHSSLYRLSAVARVDAQTLRFVLVEGKKHQIRRCARTVGLAVTDLLRVAVGPLALGDLPAGCWRVASAAEIERLHQDGHVAG